MIKLIRPPAPDRLTPETVKELTEEFKSDSNKTVWNKDYIKKALLEMSHNKCCYCECKIDEESKYLEVEHFHPKSIYKDEVVVWDNLLPSCKRCNGRKGDRDTLKEPVINPAADEPKDHLWLKNYTFKNKTSIGKNTDIFFKPDFMHISKLELKDIGVFDHLVIEFGRKLREDLADIHILTGINGTGKSTILYALAGPIDYSSIIKRFRSENSSIAINYEKSNKKDKTPYEVILKQSDKALVYNKLTVSEIHKYWYIYTSKTDINKEPPDFLFAGYSGYRTITSEKIESIKEINEHPLSSTLRFDMPTDSRLILQWIANTKAKIAFSYQEGLYCSYVGIEGIF